MITTINLPFVLVEKENIHICEFNLENVHFEFVKSEKEFKEKISFFINPRAIHYYPIVNKAAKLRGLIFNNRLKEYVINLKA